MEKKAVLEALVAQMRREIQELRKNLESVQQAVDAAPSPSQSHSDTTRFQASVMESEVKRALMEKERCLRILSAFLASGIGATDTIDIGSLVKVEERGECESYFILPEGGGMNLEDGGHSIFVLTPYAPLASQLFGHRAGDVLHLQAPRGIHEVKIVSVQ